MKFKKQISLLLAAVMTFGTVNIAFADTDNSLPDVSYTQEEEDDVIPMAKSSTDIAYAVEGGNIYFNKSKGEITDADTSIITAKIPNIIDGVAVTSIGDYAFKGCSSLTSINIPEGVTHIKNYTFDTCSSLTSIIIPSSVTSIISSAFNNCTSLSKINVLDDNDSYTDIDGVLFNKKLSSILRYPQNKTGTEYVVPESVTYIDDYAFYSCSNLTNIVLPKVTSYIQFGAFMDCSSLTDINIPDGVMYINTYTFKGCSDLEKVTIPESVTRIGESVFENCSKLTDINIPDSVTSIGKSAFKNCSKLSNININISASLRTIGASAFEKCSNLTDINIPDNLEDILRNAFKGCSSLTDINIPDTLTYLGDGAFTGCSNLSKIGNIPDSVTYFGSAFGGCSNLTSVNIPNNSEVTQISGTFKGCSKLKNIIIPDNITYIGDVTFDGCSSLEKIIIPDKVTHIGTLAFMNCSKLETITIPENVTSVGHAVNENDEGGMFSGCESLKSIYVADNNKKYMDIDGVLFDKNGTKILKYPQNKAGTTYTIPDGVLSVEESAFGGCKNLENITIPESVTSIKEAAFGGCSNLKDIIIPESVISIEPSAFGACKTLKGIYVSDNNKNYTDINGVLFSKDKFKILMYPTGRTDTEYIVPEGVTNILNNSFYYCENLKSISIPDSIQYIEYYAFNNNLKDIYYGGTKEQWESLHIYTEAYDFTMHYSDDTTSSTENTTESTTLSVESTTVTETTTESTTETTTATETKTVTETPTESTTTAAESTTEPTTEPESGSSIAIPVEGGNIYIDKDNGEVVDCDEGVISVEIPKEVNGIEIKSISATAFSGCKSLKSITIPDTITAIAENAFADCVSLTEIHCTKGSFADNKALYPENTEIKYNEAVLYGDADGNGTLNAADAAMVLQKVLKGSFKMTIEETITDYMSVTDVDRNGSLNAADAAMILQKVLKGSFKMTCEM